MYRLITITVCLIAATAIARDPVPVLNPASPDIVDATKTAVMRLRKVDDNHVEKIMCVEGADGKLHVIPRATIDYGDVKVNRERARLQAAIDALQPAAVAAKIAALQEQLSVIDDIDALLQAK